MLDISNLVVFCFPFNKLFCRIYESSQTIYRMQQMKPKDPKLVKRNPLVILQEYKVCVGPCSKI